MTDTIDAAGRPAMDERDKVARYKTTGYDAGIEPAHDGGLVRFSDYEALAARLAEVEAERAKAVTWATEQHSCADRYAARAEAAESALARLRGGQAAMVGALSWATSVIDTSRLTEEGLVNYVAARRLLPQEKDQ